MNALDDTNLSRVQAVAWFRPGREITQEWVAERFAKHLEAIAPLARARLPAVRVEIVHSAPAACAAARPTDPLAMETETWRAAADAAIAKLGVGARELDASRCGTLADALKRVGATSYNDGYHDLVSLLDTALQAVRWPPKPYATSPKTPEDPVRRIHLRGVAAFTNDVEWSFLFDSPSPWAALFELWEAGLWPFPTPDGRLITWVPSVRADSVLVADPERPAAGLPSLGYVPPSTPLEASLSALHSLAINLGLADAPGVFTYPLVGTSQRPS